jgi:hypothetical protein
MARIFDIFAFSLKADTHGPLDNVCSKAHHRLLFPCFQRWTPFLHLSRRRAFGELDEAREVAGAGAQQ